MSYRDILDKMTWSFSRLHSYETCPYSFYKKYIEESVGIDNYFAENGSIMHTTIMKIIKQELSLEDAPSYYIGEYEKICSKTKETTMSNTFEQCLEYLCTTDGIDYDKYEVVLVEEKILFKINKYQFTGYPDLILKEKENGNLILVDHKSIDHFLKKDGTVLKNQMENFRSYSHQMYLYCKWIYETYNRFPVKIVWNHFKDKGTLTIIDFNETDYLETIEWAANTIKKIYKDRKFDAHKSYMQDYVLCEFREECEYLDE